MRARLLFTLSNIFWLGTKELRSLMHDYVLLGLVVYTFTLAVISQSQSNSQELRNASLGIVDEDRSALSRQIAGAFLPPYFKKPVQIAERNIDGFMNKGLYTFVLDIPPEFERDVRAGRNPTLQVLVDATAMTQAGIGSGYPGEIIGTEVNTFIARSEPVPQPPVNLAIRVAFNPNETTGWFTSVMGIINNITMLAIILAGAAVVREREHGTMDQDPVRDRLGKSVGERPRDRGCRLVVARICGAGAAARSDQRFGSVVHVWRLPLSLFCDGHRDISRHHRADNASARASLYPRCDADEYSVGFEYPAGQPTRLAAPCDAGIAIDPFRFVCAGNSLQRGGVQRRVAALFGRRSNWCLVLGAGSDALQACGGAG